MNKNSRKLNSLDSLARELSRILIRYRAGMINLEECRQQQSLIMAMIKAYELIVMDERIARLEAVLGDRK